jgi:hypothetical protein
MSDTQDRVTESRAKYREMEAFQSGWWGGTLIAFVIALLLSHVTYLTFSPWVVGGSVVASWLLLYPIESGQDHAMKNRGGTDNA